MIQREEAVLPTGYESRPSCR